MPLISLVLLLSAPVLFAQDIPVRIQEPGQKKETQIEAGRAVEETKKREVPPGEPDVTYEQVLADPDNVDINYRYARSLVKKGNLKGAMATLERILMVNSKLPKVRLFYAIVLLQGNNLGAAESEFKTLQAGPIPDELRAELDRYLRQLEKRTRKTRLSIVVGAGIDFDDNRNAAPSSGQRLFLDVPITLDSGSTRKSDVGKIMLANISAIHDLSGGHQIFGSAGYYRAEQTNLAILNLQNYSAAAGGVYRSRWADVIPSFEFNHLLLAQTTYLRSYEPKLRFSRTLNDAFDVFAEASYAWQVYNPTSVVPVGDQRTGNKYAGGIGGGWSLNSSNRLFASYSHIEQQAAMAFDAYHRQSLTVGETSILPKGQFLLLSVTSNFDGYYTPEPAVSLTNRKDSNYRGRFTYGLPLGIVAKSLEDAIWTFTYEYYHSFSSLKNYAYSDNRISALLTYRWNSGL